MMSSAKSIAHASAEKMELSLRRAFLIIFLFKMAAHIVVLGVVCKDVEVIGVVF